MQWPGSGDDEHTLVEALPLCLLDSEVAAMSGNPIATERVRIANDALATVEQGGESR